MADEFNASKRTEQAPTDPPDGPDMAAEILRHAQDMTDDVFRHGPKAAGDVKTHVQDMTDDVVHHSRVAADDVRRETPVLIGHVWETLGDMFGTGKSATDKGKREL